MIVTLTPRTGTRFSATALPESCQGPALQYVVTPRVASWSMYPTLCPGDRLELGQAGPLRVGDLVVFRRPFGLVCHRLVTRQDTLLLTKGDACSGPPEQVLPRDVLGIVVAVTRGSSRAEVNHLSGLTPPSPWRRPFEHLYVTLRRTSRLMAGTLIRPVLRHHRLGGFIAGQIARYSTIERFEASPLRSLDAGAETGPWEPPADLTEDRERPSTGTIRLGPIYLGVFDPGANTLDIRPILAGTGAELALSHRLNRKREQR